MIVYGSQKTTAFYLSELKCENLINPLGIDNVTPHFSWKLKGNGWKGGQTYYEIQVASDSILLTQDRADLWNTGKLKSNVVLYLSFYNSYFPLLYPNSSLKLCFVFGC